MSESPTPPVFVLSCPRAGSTLFRYMLDTHPEICSPGEIALGRLIRAHHFVTQRTIALHAPENERDAICRNEVRAVLLSLMERYAKARNRRIWCDKTPENVAFIGDILWAFPETKFLCLHRRALDVVHSCLEASRWGFMEELAGYAQRSPNNLVAAMLENWADVTQALLRLEAGGAQCLRVYYEALVNAPDETMATVCSFLGVRWEDGLLEKVFEASHDPGGGDYQIRSVKRIDPGFIGRVAEINPVVLERVPPELGRS
jgi:protein-tyrosine sulfotransferase